MACAQCGAETDALFCSRCREALESRAREQRREDVRLAELAQSYHLGPLNAQYAVSRQLVTMELLLYGGCALLLLPGGIGLFVFALTSRAGSKSLQAVALFGVLIGAYLVWKLWSVISNRQVRVLLCSQGLLHLTGSSAKVFRWDELAAVEHKHREYGHPRAPYSPPTRKDWYIVRRKDGVRVSYSSDLIENLRELGERLESEAYRHGVPVRLNTN